MSQNKIFKPNQEEHFQVMFEQNEEYTQVKNKAWESLDSKLNHVPIWKRVQQNKWYSMLGLSGVVAASVIVLIVSQITGVGPIINTPQVLKPIQARAEEIEVRADSTNENGVELDSSFTITSKVDVSKAQIEEYVSITPDVGIQVTEVSKNTYNIKPQSSLADGAIYTISLQTQNPDDNSVTPLTWSFQTKESFKIRATYPRDGGTNVALNSAIKIQLTQDQVTGWENSIRLTPQVEGTIQKVNNEIIFVPTKPLIPGTSYIVYINGGITNASNETIPEQSFIFTTTFEGNSDDFILFQKQMSVFKTDEPVIIPFSGKSNSIDTRNVVIEKYADINDFIADVERNSQNTSYSYTNLQVYSARNNLEAPITLKSDIIKSDEGSQYMPIPQKLAPGYYLITSGAASTFIQITNIGGFVQTSFDSSVLWSFDPLTGTPIPNAKVKVGDTQHVTNENGILQLSRSELANDKPYVITHNDQHVVVPSVLNSVNRFSDGESNKYRSYFYTDKAAYRPSDTVEFWGYISPRDDQQVPSSVEVVLETYGTNGYTTVGTNQRLEVINNAVQGQINLADVYLNSGANISIKTLDGKLIGSVFLSIDTIDDPDYFVNIIPEFKNYYADETVQLKGSATYFDGTPIPQMPLTLTYGRETREIITNELGEYEAKVNLSTLSNVSSNFGEYFSFYIRPRDAEVAVIEGINVIRIYNKEYIELSSSYDSTTQTITYSGGVYETKLDDVRNTIYPNRDSIKGAPIAKSLNTKFKQERIEEYQDGTTYNPRTNKVEPVMYTRQVIEILEDGNVQSNNEGQFSLSRNVPAKRFTEYSITTESNTITSQNIVSSYHNTYNSISIYNSAYSINSNIEKNVYNIDRPIPLDTQVSVNVNKDNALLINKPTIFVINSNGKQTIKYSTTTQTEFTFDKALAPNAQVTAYILNDGFVNKSNSLSVRLDTSTRELQIEVTAPESITPGAQTDISFRVTDLDNKPVVSRLNVNVIDENMWSTRSNEPNILDKYFSLEDTGIITEFSTHDNGAIRGDAGAGGAGGDTRTNFKDNAYFGLLTTDADGRGSISFKAPDDITSWRVVANGISSDLKAGEDYNTLIRSTLPLFARFQLNPYYLNGDQPQVNIQAFSSELGSTLPVELTLEIPSLNIKETKQSTLFADNWIQLPALTNGTYDATLTVQSGDAKDSMQSTINVVPTRAKNTQSVELQLNNEGQITNSEALNNAQQLLITSQNKGEINSILLGYTNPTGLRLDERIAQDYARSYYYSDTIKNNYINYIDNSDDVMGYSQFENGSSDLDLNVELLKTDLPSYDKDLIHTYIDQVLLRTDESRERKITALYGKSLLGVPILNQAQQLQKLTDLTVKEKLTLILINLEYENITPVQTQYLPELLAQVEAQSNESTTSFTLDSNADRNAYLNSMLANIFSQINDKRTLSTIRFTQASNPISPFVLDIWTVDSLINLLDDSKSEEQNITITDGNIEESVKVSNNTLISTSKYNQSNLQIKGGSDIRVFAIQSIPLQPNSNGADFSIQKRYLVNGIEKSEFNETDTITVELKIIGNTTIEGCYMVTDSIPAGLKSFTLNNEFVPSRSFFAINTGSESAEFCYIYNPNKPSEPIIRYTLRASQRGQFNSEPASVYHSKDKTKVSTSGSQTITVL